MITIEEALVKGAFEELMSGNKDRHDAMVSATAQELARASRNDCAGPGLDDPVGPAITARDRLACVEQPPAGD